MEQLNLRLSVHDIEGKVVDNLQLDENLFDGTVNKALLYEAIKMYEANTRQGNASTKTRSDVSGGGSKPWRQKGTGRARFGSSRNPIWRHGGVAHGPKPRNHSYSIPRKALKKALLSSLNARLIDNKIKLVVKVELEEIKTKAIATFINNLNIKEKILFVVDNLSKNVTLSFRNIPNVTLVEQKNLNAKDILINDSLVLEKEAILKISERLK